MNSRFIQSMSETLNNERKELRQELSSFTDKNTQVAGDYVAKKPEYGDSLEDGAQETEDYERELPIEHSLEKRLFEIEDALKRMKEGIYGICEDCHEEITSERLQALPSARYCMECAPKKEHIK